jgi:hypothetical protein
MGARGRACGFPSIAKAGVARPSARSRLISTIRDNYTGHSATRIDIAVAARPLSVELRGTDILHLLRRGLVFSEIQRRTEVLHFALLGF